MSKKRKKKITRKAVQAMESTPYVPVDVTTKPENDDDEDTGIDGLSVRRRLFVEYLVGEARGNARKAAKLAGYSDSNSNVLKQTASRLLTFVDVQEAVAHRLAALRLTAEWTRCSIADYAGATMAAFISVDENGEPVVDWNKAAAAGAIGHVKEIKEDGIKEDGGKFTLIKRTFKIHDPLPARQLLAKMHGLIDADAPGLDEPRIRSRTINRHADVGSN